MAVKKTTVKTKKTARRSSPKKTGSEAIVFRRIVIISACLVLAVVFVAGNRQAITQSVAGTSIVKGMYMQATIEVPDIPEAVAYNIYYKQANDKDFTNTARDIAPTLSTYTISHLQKGIDYQYRIAAVDANGNEFLWSETVPLTNLQSM